MLYSLNKIKRIMKFTKLTNNLVKQRKFDWYARKYNDIEYYRHKLKCGICGAVRSYSRAYANHVQTHGIDISGSLEMLDFLTRSTEEKIDANNLGERIKQQIAVTRPRYEEEFEA